MKEFKIIVREYISGLLRSSAFKGVAVLLIFVSVGFVSELSAQEPVAQSAYRIKGIVRDAYSRQPINAAQINSLYSANSAVSDSLGNFEIGLLSNEEVLTLSVYDYNTRQVAVS